MRQQAVLVERLDDAAIHDQRLDRGDIVGEVAIVDQGFDRGANALHYPLQARAGFLRRAKFHALGRYQQFDGDDMRQVVVHLGQPPGGWPEALQKKVLKGREPVTVRPGSLLEPVDLDAERRKLDEGHEYPVTDYDLASYLMYPKVFTEFRRHREEYGDVDVLPTHVYFYGMQPEEEIVATMEDGRRIVIRHLTAGDTDDRGYRRVFFEVNGQPSSVLIQDRSSESAHHENEKADSTNANHVGAPMPGMISTISVEVGQEVKRGDTLLTMEAMKMETSITAERDAVIKRVLARIGEQFDAKDLLVEFD